MLDIGEMVEEEEIRVSLREHNNNETGKGRDKAP